MKKHNLFKGVLALVLALVLVATSVSAIGVKADETPAAPTLPAAVDGTVYDPMSDTITNATKSVVYVLKNEKDNKLKASAEAFTLDSKGLSIVDDLKIKGTTKNIYLYVCAKELEADFDKVNANVVIKAQAAKKVVGVIDYTQADNAESTKVLSATATDANKKPIESVTAIWSADGEKYDTADKFTGAELKKMLADGGIIYVKMLGDAETKVRTSSPVKVKIAKEGKAPKVKLDVKKGTLSFKNGYDIVEVVEEKAGVYVLADKAAWTTYLPYNKEAKNKAVSVETANYAPADKKNTDAVKAESGKLSFTSTKIKTIDATAYAGKTIAVRVSATDKKPASAIAYYKISTVANGPQIYTIENICSVADEDADETPLTIATNDAKFELKVPTIVNFTSAWTGVGEAVKPADKAEVDAAAASYEMAVIKKADLGAVDFSTVAWKSVKAGAKITDKLKTKYTTVAEDGKTTAVEATLKAGAATAADTDVYLVIRRAGVKGKTVDDSVLASKNLVTRVYKANKTYTWVIVPEDKQVLVGAAGKLVEIAVSTWDEETGAYKANADAAVSKYLAADDDKTLIEVPVPDGCDLFVGDATEKAASNKVEQSSAVTFKVKATIAVEGGKVAAKQYYLGNEDVAIEINVPDGKVIDKVTVDGKDLDKAESYVIAKVVNVETKVVVTFKNAEPAEAGT